MFDTSHTWLFMIIAWIIFMIGRGVISFLSDFSDDNNLLKVIFFIPMLISGIANLATGFYLISGVLFYIIAFIKFLWYAA
jgi:predicted membrane channel-forming protein YqfA (hemolysin III family)